MAAEQVSRVHVKKTSILMKLLMTRHLTPEEIALNQQELTCSSETEKLEMQEASLEHELEQDINENRRMIIVQTLRVIYRALLTQYRDLARVRGSQITSLQRTLRSYE
jgi:hypothetical protein